MRARRLANWHFTQAENRLAPCLSGRRLDWPTSERSRQMQREQIIDAFRKLSAEDQAAVRAELVKDTFEASCCPEAMKEQLLRSWYLLLSVLDSSSHNYPGLVERRFRWVACREEKGVFCILWTKHCHPRNGEAQESISRRS